MFKTKPVNEVVSNLWFKYQATYESTLMQYATALQIAMRNLLRDRYWLTNCEPLGTVAVSNVRKHMERTNARDVITQEEVDELLTREYGFEKDVSPDGEFIGWHIPALAAERGVMLETRAADRDRKATVRGSPSTRSKPTPAPIAGRPVAVQEPVADPVDF